MQVTSEAILAKSRIVIVIQSVGTKTLAQRSGASCIIITILLVARLASEVACISQHHHLDDLKINLSSKASTWNAPRDDDKYRQNNNKPCKNNHKPLCLRFGSLTAVSFLSTSTLSGHQKLGHEEKLHVGCKADFICFSN